MSGLVLANNIQTTANGIINSGPGVFTLNGSIGGVTGDATSNDGSFTLLNAGATDGGSLTVGIDTGSAGHKVGTATLSLASDGAGTSGFSALSLTAQTINVSGDVYRLAAANVIGAVQFGNVHVGDVVSQALNLTNTAVNDGFSERLDASFDGVVTGTRTQTTHCTTGHDTCIGHTVKTRIQALGETIVNGRVG